VTETAVVAVVRRRNGYQLSANSRGKKKGLRWEALSTSGESSGQ